MWCTLKLCNVLLWFCLHILCFSHILVSIILFSFKNELYIYILKRKNIIAHLQKIVHETNGKRIITFLFLSVPIDLHRIMFKKIFWFSFHVNLRINGWWRGVVLYFCIGSCRETSGISANQLHPLTCCELWFLFSFFNWFS